MAAVANVLLAAALVGILIFVHESGHFLVAKACGVKVLKFSLGFGPPIFKVKRGDTEFCISYIPLGGFVKMAGDDPSEVVPAADRHRTLAGKPIWQRFCIMGAGPAMNLTFPVLLYFIFFAFSSAYAARPAATIGYVEPGTPAMTAGLLPGDRVVSIDGEPIKYFEELQDHVADGVGHEVVFEIERPGAARTLKVPIVPESTAGVDAVGIRRDSGRIGVAKHYLSAQIGVDAGSPAARAGLRTWDLVRAVNGVPLKRWVDLDRILAANRGEPLEITVSRGERAPVPFAEIHYRTPDIEAVVRPVPVGEVDGPTYSGVRDSSTYVHDVTPGSPAATAGVGPGDRIVSVSGTGLTTAWDFFRTNIPDGRPLRVTFAPASGKETKTVVVSAEQREMGEGVQMWTLGATRLLPVEPEPDMVPVDNRIAYAAVHSVELTGVVIGATAQVLTELFRGKRPLGNVGGPLTIVRAAAKAAERGWDHYLWIMAIISINLGLINLLPIPVLDGGHLLFYAVEAVRRRPVSLRFREIASFVGLSIIIVLLVFVLKNDIEKWVW
jgi:regulator of sigma E protease